MCVFEAQQMRTSSAPSTVLVLPDILWISPPLVATMTWRSNEVFHPLPLTQKFSMAVLSQDVALLEHGQNLWDKDSFSEDCDIHPPHPCRKWPTLAYKDFTIVVLFAIILALLSQSVWVKINSDYMDSSYSMLSRNPLLRHER